MVVDDEPAIAGGIADTLAALTGHIYHPYSDALQALEPLQTDRTAWC